MGHNKKNVMVMGDNDHLRLNIGKISIKSYRINP
jgi:hypothetical protein